MSGMRDAPWSTAPWESPEDAGSPLGIEAWMSGLERRLRESLEFEAVRLFIPAGTGESVGNSALFRAKTGYAPRECASMLSVPLEDAVGLAGVLTLQSRAADAFDPADLGALLLIRAELASGLRHAIQRSHAASGDCAQTSRVA
jgi:hypothetical protein